MLGLTTHASTNTNQLQVNIPDELVGIELQVIILPATQSETTPIIFFSENDLQNLANGYVGKSINDHEDYSKW